MAGDIPQIKLQSVSVPDKGRGMVPPCDVSPGSLVHAEEPYATVRNNYFLFNIKFILSYTCTYKMLLNKREVEMCVLQSHKFREISASIESTGGSIANDPLFSIFLLPGFLSRELETPDLPWNCT